MGSCLSICSGKTGEAKKATAFQTNDGSELGSGGGNHLHDDHHHHHLRSHFPTSDDGALTGSASFLDGSANHNNINNTNTNNNAQQQLSTSLDSTLDSERLKSLREEQARLDLVVATTGRDMVAVRSTRGSTGYYDQGFAAALAQHLEQTTEFPNRLPQRLPPPAASLLLQQQQQQQQQQQHDDKSDKKIDSKNSAAVAAASASKQQQQQHHHPTSTTTTTTTTNANGSITTSSTTTTSTTASSDATSSSSSSSSSASASALYAILSQPMWDGIVLGPSREGLAGCAGENPSRYMDRVAESILDIMVPTKEELFAGLGPMVENLL